MRTGEMSVVIHRHCLKDEGKMDEIPSYIFPTSLNW